MRNSKFPVIYFGSILLVLLVALLSTAANNNTPTLLPLVIPGSVPSASRQGSTGTKVFFCTGAFTNGHLVSVDASGNCIDSGVTSAGLITGALFTSTANATITNSGTTLIGTGVGSTTLAANYFSAGTTLHIFISGFYSSAGTPGSLSMSIKLGGVAVIGAGAIVPVAAANTAPWSLDTYLVCRTTGTMGTIVGQGLATFTNSTTSTTLTVPLGNNSTTFDTTGTLAVDVSAIWNSFAAGDTITGMNTVITQI
jgi:hypothetical protein